MTLTQALLALAAVVLAALVLHGWWTTRRASPKKPALAADTQPAERTDPALGGEPPPLDAEDTQPDLRPAVRRLPRLDALIDALVPIELDAPVAAEAVLAHLPPSRRAGSKPFYVEGLDTITGDWDLPSPGRRYSSLQAGVQLASRSGALNEIEYSEFVQKIGALAEALGATPDFPDMLDVVARARELDDLTSPLDAQLTLLLRSKGVAWSVAYIQQSAARHGFVPGVVPGRMVVPSPDEGAPPMLQLSIDAQAAMAALGGTPQDGVVHELTLTLDVPQTPQTAEPYPAWHRAAMALAEDMDASVVDDQGRPLTLQSFAAIAGDLQQLYAQLDALDVAAGSPAARRLFS
jgi:hypothetical protein